jgi:hypothetical protein
MPIYIYEVSYLAAFEAEDQAEADDKVSNLKLPYYMARSQESEQRPTIRSRIEFVDTYGMDLPEDNDA